MPTRRPRTAVTASVAALALVLATHTGAGAGEAGAGTEAEVTSSSVISVRSRWELIPQDDHPIDDGKGDLDPDSITADEALLQRLSDVPCTDGTAGPFPCENVDLLSFVPVEELGGANANDLWGWTDPQTGREYAIVGTGYTTAFVDITTPTDPVVVGVLPSESAGYIPLWRDVKVHDDHAYIVSEHTGHGMQVLDLTRLRDPAVTPITLTPDAVYDEVSWAHNIAINTDTGYAYIVGSDTCEGGLHMVDLSEPKAPTFAGCFSEDGYTHDVQCVTYHGPAGKYRGRELCFASNEDTVTIVDVTDKDAPVMLSRTGYDSAAYTHQGWLTEDHRWFLFGDELDEQRGTVSNTTTYIMDVRKPDRPGSPVAFHHQTSAIDHNLYIVGSDVYEANYTEGLRVLRFDDDSLAAGHLDEVAFFDVVPQVDIEEFAGAWSSYPFYDSGVVAVSSIEGGLFVLQPHLPEEPSGPPHGPKRH